MARKPHFFSATFGAHGDDSGFGLWVLGFGFQVFRFLVFLDVEVTAFLGF